MIILCRFEGLYGRVCVVCVGDSSFFQTPLGAAAIQAIKKPNKWEYTILPAFLIRFICGEGFFGIFLFGFYFKGS